MFDRTNISLPDTINQQTTIHEHRAPTDESVKLLREMEEAAGKKILDSITVRSTLFECKVLRQHNFVNCEDEYLAIFSLNGKKIKTHLTINVFETNEHGVKIGKTEVFLKLVEAVAKDIAKEILVPAFVTMKDR